MRCKYYESLNHQSPHLDTSLGTHPKRLCSTGRSCRWIGLVRTTRSIHQLYVFLFSWRGQLDETNRTRYPSHQHCWHDAVSIFCSFSPYGSEVSTLANIGYRSGWSAKASAPTLGMWDAGSGLTTPHGGYMLAPQRASLGKRPRGGEETSCTSSGEENGGTTCGPRKKFKGNMGINGVLVAAGHASRAHLEPATGTPEDKTNKFEATERGAGTLAIPNVQEVCRSFLPGPSVQGSVGTTAQERLGGEGSEQGITEATERDVFQIPRRLGKVYKALLKASSADWTCGFVRTLKCRLCPSADFGTGRTTSGIVSIWRPTLSRYYFATTAETSSRGRMRWIGIAGAALARASLLNQRRLCSSAR
jgi:hypothetical protein